MRRISGLILRLMGWKVTRGIPKDIPKCVVAVAPHTSMWDFVIGRLAFWSLGVQTRFLIKKEMFFWPIGPIIRWMGAIPVDRQKRGRLVDQLAALFDQHDSLYIAITPEGTRKLVTSWKKGFYYIALKAKIPIALGVLDYRKKTGGVVKIFEPTGDYQEDIQGIEKYYRGAGAKHPEKFNLS